MTEFLALSFFFWAELIAMPVFLLLAFIALADENKEGFAFFMFSVFIGVGLLFSGTHADYSSTWVWLKGLSLIGVLIYVAVYLALGLGIVMVKWYLAVRDDAEKIALQFRAALNDFDHTDGVKGSFTTEGRNARGGSTIINAQVTDYIKTLPLDQQKVAYARASLHYKKKGEIIKDCDVVGTSAGFTAAISTKFRDNLTRLTYMLIEWPIVFLDMIFRNLVTRICREIMTLFRGLFDRVSRFAYRDVEEL